MKYDTRNNWITFMFKCKFSFNCFRKQSVIDDCREAFQELESLGFKFRKFGFAGNHVHFDIDIPKKYSILVTEIMLKSRSSKRIFEKHPNFRKRFPRGSFWSGYEHHQSTGLIDREKAEDYIEDQSRHHGVDVIDDLQKKISIFVAEPGYCDSVKSQRGLGERGL
jgi:REP element-mobilizing transposase RayT